MSHQSATTASPTPSSNSTNPYLARGGIGSSAPPDDRIARNLARLSTAGDLALLLETAKLLVAQDVAGMAWRLLGAVSGPAGSHPEIERLKRELASAPSGEVDLAALRARFETNSALLIDRQPWLRPVLESHSSSPADAFSVFMTRSGNEQIVFAEPANSLRLALPYADRSADARSIALDGAVNAGTVMLHGVPSIALLQRAAELQGPNGYRPPIDLIEPDASFLRLWLHLCDIVQFVEREQLFIFAGEKAHEHYLRLRARRLDRLDPTHLVHNPRRGLSEGAVKTLLETRVRPAVMAEVSRRTDLQAERYGSMTPARWLERYRRAGADQPELKALALTTRFSTVMQYALRDLAAAMSRRGIQCRVEMEASDSSSAIDTLSLINRESCDLVIVVNHLRWEMGDRIHPNLPFVGWMQDYMPALWSKDSAARMTPLDLIISPSALHMEAVCGYPADQHIESSNLTDPHAYHDGPVDPELQERFTADVAYVSHGSATPEALRDEMIAANPQLRPVLDRLLPLIRAELERQGSLGGIAIYRLAREALVRAGGDGANRTAIAQLHPVAMALYDRILRHQTLEWAAEWARGRGRTLRIHGRGWETHPTLAEFAAGPVENGEPLRAAYRSATVNLQINAHNSLHQRLLDGLACGSFIASRYNPADFYRLAHRRIARWIDELEIGELGDLFEAAAEHGELASDLRSLHELGVAGVNPDDAEQREREREEQVALGAIPAELGDDARFFELLHSMRGVPRRTAGDIDGFSETAFGSAAELNALLDRAVDDQAWPADVARRMRACVIQHDTFDALIDRVLERLEQRFAELAGEMR